MKCSKCGRSILGRSHTSPLGQPVCGPCSEKLNGTILGGAVGGAGGAAAGPSLGKMLRDPLGLRRKRP